MLQRFKQLLTLAGTQLSNRQLHWLQMLVNYLKLGRWHKENNYRFPKLVPSRYEVFDTVIRMVKAPKVLYLEFGVFEGKATRYWSENLKDLSTEFHGFDSFEGLPEDFDNKGPYERGTFDVGGKTPEINDVRVRFHKGWFEDTLPSFVVPEHDSLIVILDADLYSATKFVLGQLHPHIKPGTFIYFDDMSRPDHEPKAFAEYVKEHSRTFEPIVADYSLNRSFFRCVV